MRQAKRETVERAPIGFLGDEEGLSNTPRENFPRLLYENGLPPLVGLASVGDGASPIWKSMIGDMYRPICKVRNNAHSLPRGRCQWLMQPCQGKSGYEITKAGINRRA